MKLKSVRYGVFALVSTVAIAQTPQQTELPLNNSTIKTLTGDLIPEHQEVVRPGSSPTTTGPLETVPESCRFSLSLAPGEQAKEARSMSDLQINRVNGTCEGQFEVGEPSQDELDAMAAPSGSESITTDAGGTGAAHASAEATTGHTSSAGWAKSWYETILGPVTVAQSNVGWNWRPGACVTPVSGSGSWKAGGAGFAKTGFSVSRPTSCAETTTVSDLTTRNLYTPICSPIPSVTHIHLRIAAQGQQNGTLVGIPEIQTIDNTGFQAGCLNNFHFKWALKRTLN